MSTCPVDRQYFTAIASPHQNVCGIMGEHRITALILSQRFCYWSLILLVPLQGSDPDGWKYFCGLVASISLRAVVGVSNIQMDDSRQRLWLAGHSTWKKRVYHVGVKAGEQQRWNTDVRSVFKKRVVWMNVVWRNERALCLKDKIIDVYCRSNISALNKLKKIHLCTHNLSYIQVWTHAYTQIHWRVQQ